MGESMKKVLFLMITALLALALTACAGNSVPTEPAVTEAPTEAKYIDTQLSEPEWTLAEGKLQLEGNGTVYADNTEILYFAIVTETDGKQSLWFRLTDEASVKLQTQPIDGDCYMTFNDEKIGTATLNDDCTIAKVFSENTAGEITSWASKIRGLA